MRGSPRRGNRLPAPIGMRPVALRRPLPHIRSGRARTRNRISLSAVERKKCNLFLRLASMCNRRLIDADCGHTAKNVSSVNLFRSARRQWRSRTRRTGKKRLPFRLLLPLLNISFFQPGQAGPNGPPGPPGPGGPNGEDGPGMLFFRA